MHCSQHNKVYTFGRFAWLKYKLELSVSKYSNMETFQSSVSEQVLSPKQALRLVIDCLQHHESLLYTIYYKITGEILAYSKGLHTIYLLQLEADINRAFAETRLAQSRATVYKVSCWIREQFFPDLEKRFEKYVWTTVVTEQSDNDFFIDLALIAHASISDSLFQGVQGAKKEAVVQDQELDALDIFESQSECPIFSKQVCVSSGFNVPLQAIHLLLYRMILWLQNILTI